MKTVATIIAAMFVSAAITYIVTSSSVKTKAEDRKATVTTKQSEELAKLRARIQELETDADSHSAVVLKETGDKASAVATDPADFIDKLSADETTGADVESQRRIIHYYESLVDAGDASLPAIANFMNQKLDKEFGRPSFRQQLNITNTQMEEMREAGRKLMEENGPKMRDIMRNQELSWDERREQMRALWQDSTTQFLDLMTDEQKAQLEQMGGDQGDRIRMMMRSFGGGRGPGGPGGDRGGRGPGGRGPGGR